MKSIWIRKCGFNDENCIYLLSKFLGKHNIDAINFSDCELTEKSLLPLINFLKEQPLLKDLGLSSILMSNMVLELLSVTLPFWPNLQSLYISSI